MKEHKKHLYLCSSSHSEKEFLYVTIYLDQAIYYVYSNKKKLTNKEKNEIEKEYLSKGLTLKFFEVNFDKLTSVFEYLAQIDLIPKAHYFVHFFDSINDLVLFLGKENSQKYFKPSYPKQRNVSYIIQKRCIDGFIFQRYDEQLRTFDLHDIHGWSKKKDLNEFSSSLNLRIPKEQEQSTHKNIIHSSINKLLVLSKINNKMIGLVNNIAKSIGLQKDLFNENNIPSGIGSITAKILQKFLENEFGKEGLKKEFLECYQRSGVSPLFGRKKKISNIVSGASITTILNKYSLTSGILNGLTQGGRTYNERWQEYLAENVLDIDFVGCYSTALENFIYPIGLPTCYHQTFEEKKITLRTFLKAHEAELVPNLYTITISGTLDFSQNLLYSKLITANRLQRLKTKLETNDGENETLTGDFVILEKQLINTIITHDIWMVLKKICSPRELKTILDMEVETALYYPRSQKVSKEELVKEWENVDLSETYGISKEDSRGENHYDYRPRIWAEIPLKNLIKPLREKREQLKKDKKNKDLQEQYKLILNSLYGVLASPYFEVGNVVISNNITAKARVQIWMASRTLNGIQCITDGFQYQPMNIYKIEIKNNKNSRRLPGLKKLSDLANLEESRVIKKGILGKKSEKEWIEYFNKPMINWEIDQYAKTHINEFWSHYDLQLDYNIEHKHEHTSKKMFYIKKAHYSTQSPDGTLIHKYRGISPTKEQIPQYYTIAESIINNTECELKTLEYKNIIEAKISDYLEQKAKGIELMPGEIITKITILSLTDEDLPSINHQHHMYKKRYKQEYAYRFLTEKRITNIFEERLLNYTIKRENYEKR